MLKAIIFDMDGVLINSTPYIEKAFDFLLKQNGIIAPNGYWKNKAGLSLKDTLKIFKEDFGVEFEFQDFAEKVTEIQVKLMKDANEFDEDIKLHTFLKEAKRENIKLSVATSSRLVRANEFLRLLKIHTFFDVVIGAEDVEKHKPNPDVFLKAANRLDIEPKNCVVIEDALNGIEAAHSGGMKVIGKVTHNFNENDLKIADLVINDFSELNVA